MPKMDGIDATRHNPPNMAGTKKLVPIIALTAPGRETIPRTRLRAAGMGDDLHFPRPINFEHTVPPKALGRLAAKRVP